MTTRKTAISIEERLFDRADTAAAEMGVSRSQLYAAALDEFLKKRENEQLLAEINKAYSTPPTREELETQAMMSEYMGRAIEDEW